LIPANMNAITAIRVFTCFIFLLVVINFYSKVFKRLQI
jgi:hypothetical protein